MQKNLSSNRTDLRLLGVTAINVPIVECNTSGRLTMSATQDTQIPVINKPEDAIVDTGFATQLVNFTYSIVIENTSVFLKLVKKFNNRTDMWSNDEWSSLVLFVLDTETNSLVHYDIPRFRLLGNKFGFSYNIDVDYLFSLSPKDIIPANTRVAWSNASSENTHKKGRNLNMFACSLPEVNEDTTLICRDVIEDYGIKLYEEYETSYGKSSLLGDVHGKDGVYKAFPDIGDSLNASDVLFAKINLDLRELKNENWGIINNAMLYTDKGLRKYRPHFVDHTLLRYPGTVVDIDLHFNSKSGENIESDSIGQQTAKYLMMLKTYYNNIVETYESFSKLYPNAKISPASNNLIVDAMTFIEKPIKGKVPNITRSKKRSKLDMYTLKIMMECDIKVNNGFKYSDRYGG